MLSKKLHEAMNAQINAELWSAYLYLSMSMDAEAKGLKGVANWFYVQFQEEQDHARIFMNYILSRDAEVKLRLAIDRLTGRADESAVVVLSTPVAEAGAERARAHLEAFLAAHAGAIRATLEAPAASIPR